MIEMPRAGMIQRTARAIGSRAKALQRYRPCEVVGIKTALQRCRPCEDVGTRNDAAIEALLEHLPIALRHRMVDPPTVQTPQRYSPTGLDLDLVKRALIAPVRYP